MAVGAVQITSLTTAFKRNPKGSDFLPVPTQVSFPAGVTLDQFETRSWSTPDGKVHIFAQVSARKGTTVLVDGRPTLAPTGTFWVPISTTAAFLIKATPPAPVHAPSVLVQKPEPLGWIALAFAALAGTVGWTLTALATKPVRLGTYRRRTRRRRVRSYMSA